MYIPLLHRRHALGMLLSLPNYCLLPPHQKDTTTELLHQMAYQEGTSLKELQTTSFQRIRDAVGDETRVVLLGEATHGTQEFYQTRAQLTRTLLEQDGFDAVLCEGDFEPFWHLNKFVGGCETRCTLAASQSEMSNVLDVFLERFPVWMWRNDIMKDFCLWLHHFNKSRDSKVQLLGLDIFGMFQSMDQVIHFLAVANETALADSAGQQYSTLNSYRPEPKGYSIAYENGNVKSQAENAKAVLNFLAQNKQRLSQETSLEEFFHAYESARVVVAEAYFRQVQDDVASWNLRDSAFIDAIRDAMAFVEQSSGKRTLASLCGHTILMSVMREPRNIPRVESTMLVSFVERTLAKNMSTSLDSRHMTEQYVRLVNGAAVRAS